MSVFDQSTDTTTTMPSWFTNAQQSAVQGATNAANAAVAPNQTVGQGLVTNLQSPNNAFTTGMGTLQNIASGAANPWLPNGQPDTSTALGGLFSAQNAQLNQILPSVAAKEGAAGIGSGNFGGLRGQTAVNTAKAGALTTLAEQQNQAALNAQTQAVQAENALGNLGSQYGTTALNTANWQQLGSLPTQVQLANALAATGQNVNKTTSAVTNKGDYANALAAATALGGLGNVVTGTNTNYPWLNSLINSISSGLGSSDVSQITNSALPGDPGYGWSYYTNGVSIDPNGNYYQGDQLIWSPNQG